jgi:hypothetical protein
MMTQPLIPYTQAPGFSGPMIHFPVKHPSGINQESTLILPAPKQDGLILSNEHGLRRKSPSWEVVTAVVRGLDAGSGNSFCILEDPDSNYVQALRGFNGYHLEWHKAKPGESSMFQQYRASYHGGSPKGIELKKGDHLSQSELDLDGVDDKDAPLVAALR